MFSPDLHPPPPPPVVPEAAAIALNNEIDRPHLFSYLGNAGSMHGAKSHSHNPRGEDTRLLNAAEWGLSVSRGGQIQEDLCQTGLINLRFLLFLSQDEILLEKAGVWLKNGMNAAQSIGKKRGEKKMKSGPQTISHS